MFAFTIVVVMAVTPGIPDAAKARYAEASQKLRANDYPHANDILNQLAGQYPRWPEIFASRCSAQLGLQHWDAAAADCNYALQLKPRLPAAMYGLAVAEDGRRHYPEAVKAYREYAALNDPEATLKLQATQRADVLTPKTGGLSPPPPPPAVVPASAAVKGTFQPGIPSPNRMLLYVFRNLLMGLNTPVALSVDGKPAGDLPNDTYVELDLAPGKHTVVVKAAGPNGRDLPAAWELNSMEGDVSYVKLEYAPQGEDVAFKPIPTAGSVGRKEIREDCALISSRRL
jgi:hypothetical protein